MNYRFIIQMHTPSRPEREHHRIFFKHFLALLDLYLRASMLPTGVTERLRRPVVYES